jgi:hypothetical protein
MRPLGTTKRKTGYEAQLCVRREIISLGMYDTAEQAHEIWKIAKANKDLYNRENKDWFRDTIIAYEAYRRLRDNSVGYSKIGNRYRVYISKNYVKIYMGTFDSELKASRVYETAKGLLDKFRGNVEQWRQLVTAKALT